MPENLAQEELRAVRLRIGKEGLGLVLLEAMACGVPVIATADFTPTDQQREGHEVLRERLRRVREELEALLTTDLPAFNRLLQPIATCTP